MIDHSNIFFGNGTTQYGRINPAFQPGFAAIDSRNTQELLCLGAAYARLAKFYNLRNQEDGNWEPFFTNDITTLLAEILSTDTEGIEQDYNQLVDKTLNIEDIQFKKETFLKLLRFVADIVRTIDRWYVQSTRLITPGRGIEQDVSGELLNIITKKLAPSLQILQQFETETGKAFGAAPELELAELNRVWSQQTTITRTPPLFTGDKDLPYQINQAAIKLRPVYRNFGDTLSGITFQFKRYFDRSLESKNNHAPNMGLFLAFLQLMKFGQESLNSYAPRLLELYYAFILLQNRLPNRPDKVHVCFQLTNQAENCFLPAGTQLSAGFFDDGAEILYETVQDLEITQAGIEQTKTLYLSKSIRESLTTYEIVSNIYAATVPNSKDGHGTPFDLPNQSWPTFGEEQFNKLEELTNMAQASVGLAIASPILSLREGTRSVEIHFRFAPESVRVYEKLIDDVQQKLQLPSREDAFFKIFNTTGGTRNITILVSSIRGWFKADPSEIKINLPNGAWTPEGFSIYFKLHVYDPAIAPFDPRLFPNEFYNTENPVVKIIANSEREPYIYSFLKQVCLEEVDIHVAVDSLKKCQLYNNIGALDTTQPFQVFGPTPGAGSYLLLGTPELFRKKILQASIDIDWHELPKTVDAFHEYFKDYNLRAEDYAVRLSVLKGGAFHPEEQERLLEFPLFHWGENRALKTRFELNPEILARLRMDVSPGLPNNNPFDPDTQTGYFKLELLQPEEGFGYAAYQRVITRAMAQNAKAISDSANGETEPQQLEIPNPPIAPTAKNIRLSYSATAQIRLSDNSPEYPQEIFHIHPFGEEKRYPALRSSNQGNIPMLPQYDDDGYLFLGLRQVKPRQTLSLFLQMVAVNYYDMTMDTMPEINWSYLSRNNEWRPFNDRDVLSDSTDKFTRSGIIRLRIPDDISNRCGVLPSGLFWIRASVKGKVEALSHTIEIHAQAVQAQWIDNGHPAHLENPLPPQTIFRLVDRKGEIQSVRQPFESFEGQPVENDQAYFTRVSEMLRHKNRAVTHWDFERITLACFPEIAQVKCISYLSHPVFDKPKGPETPTTLKAIPDADTVNEIKVSGVRKGDGITLVVIPKRSRYLNEQTPAVNYKLLHTITQTLRACASPFTKIVVRNPEYEFLRIYCKIKFRDKGNDGHWIAEMKRDLRRFICPWMENDDSQVEIGGSLSVEAVKNFISALPYVKFVTRLSLLHIIIEEEHSQTYHIEDTAEKHHNKTIFAGKPWSVLVADEDHVITVTDGEEIEEAPTPVTPPVSFKSEYDILKRYRPIRIIERKYELKLKEVAKDSDEQNILTIKL